MLPELPDYLIPRRGSDMTPRDYADLVATGVGSIPEQELSGLIDRLDTMTLGAPAADLIVEEEGVSRPNAEMPSEAEVPRFLALGILRMLLRSRQLALQHDPENADKHVRELSRKWAAVFVEFDRELRGSDDA